ncbi:MAG: UPF0175 family protein [Promethearchaeia archaeon]
MNKKVSVEIPGGLKQRIDELKKKMQLDLETLLRLLLHDAVAEKEIDLAIQEYQKGHVTLGEAVLIANTDYWTFLDILHDRKISANINEQDHKREIQKVRNKEYRKYINAESSK